MAQKTTGKAARGARRGSGSTSKTESSREEAPEGTEENTPEGAEQTSANATGTVREELTAVVRDAALEVLRPVAKKATTEAAKYTVTKGPGLAKDKIAPKIDQAGGIGEIANNALAQSGTAGKIASKLGVGGKLAEGVLGDGEGEGGDLDATGSGRRMPIQQSMDVGAPIQRVYNHWTEYEEYPRFMHRVDSVDQSDETHVAFTEKVWGFGRRFEAEIVEQYPDDRIVWKSVEGLSHTGIVTFHELGPNLTRVLVSVDFKPESLFQKFARGARFSKRAIRADMHRFKAWIEMPKEDEEEEQDVGWRGVIENGEVVQGPEEAEQGQEPEAEGEEAPAAEADEEVPEAEEEGAEDEDQEDEGPVATEPSAEEPDEEEAEDEGEEEDEPAPKPRTRSRKSTRRRSPARKPRRRAPARA